MLRRSDETCISEELSKREATSSLPILVAQQQEKGSGETSDLWAMAMRTKVMGILAEQMEEASSTTLARIAATLELHGPGL